MKNKIKRLLCLLVPIIILGSEVGLTIWSFATTGHLLPAIQGYNWGVTAGLAWAFALVAAEEYK